MRIIIMSRLYHGIVGGVERMSIELANSMASRGNEVILLSWDNENASMFYQLDARVSWRKLNIGDASIRAGLALRMRRILALRKLIRSIQPDVVIAFQQGTFWNAITGTYGSGVPVIAAERNAPNRFDHLEIGKRRNWLFQTFRLAARVTVQFPDYILGYPEYLHSRIVAIENPVLPAKDSASPAIPKNGEFRLLSVGRLTYQKNHQALIKAFHKLAEKHAKWRLEIVGDGEASHKLTHLVSELQLTNRVTFVGSVKNVSHHYEKAHLFCLASRWEGFPNAVAEAMAHGLPCVGYVECAGMPQLISAGVTGELAAGNGDPNTLATALDALMSDDTTRANQGYAAKSISKKYSLESIFDRWEVFLKDVISAP